MTNTHFISNKYNVKINHLSTHFKDLEGVETLTLLDLSFKPRDSGSYIIKSIWDIDGTKASYNIKTNNMSLVDAWNLGIEGFEDGEDGFEDWDSLIKSILATLDPEDMIYAILDNSL
jgi:hypothetical protein